MVDSKAEIVLSFTEVEDLVALLHFWFCSVDGLDTNTAIRLLDLKARLEDLVNQ